jgi:geranylgeranyl reductase
MLGGRLAAEAVAGALTSGDARDLRHARRQFMREHGKVFWVLGVLQWFWYCSDQRRERFVTLCKDPDIQQLTWQAYMHKKLVRGNPLAQVRIFFKDLAHLLGVVRA